MRKYAHNSPAEVETKNSQTLNKHAVSRNLPPKVDTRLKRK